MKKWLVQKEASRLVVVATAMPLEFTNGEFTPNGLYQSICYLALLQFLTAILNILPVPGFDGFGAIAPYLSAATQRAIGPIRPWAPLVFFVLIFSVPQINSYLFDPAYRLMDLFGNRFTYYAAGLGQNAFQFWR